MNFDHLDIVLDVACLQIVICFHCMLTLINPNQHTLDVDYDDDLLPMEPIQSSKRSSLSMGGDYVSHHCTALNTTIKLYRDKCDQRCADDSCDHPVTASKDPAGVCGFWFRTHSVKFFDH